MTNEKSPQEQSKDKKKITFLALGIVVLIGVVGFFFFSSGDSQEVVPQETKLQIIYVNIDKPFIFNVTGDKRKRLVQVRVQLMVRGDENEKLAKENLPLVEHSLLSAFSSATVEQLRTSRGQLEIRQSAGELVKVTMTEVTGKPVIERVLFTGFVMQ